MKVEIKKRFSAEIIFTAELSAELDTANEATKLGAAIKIALKADAYLAGANLARAYLAVANLAGAYLAGANLAGANLARADLADADLAGANLAGAYLADAYLAGANLARADLADADLAGANLAGANLTGANLTGKIEEKDIPVISKIDAIILSEIENGGVLDMSVWHGPQGWCGTTHCRAGWAIHCAGNRGRELEQKVGTKRAAQMIYRASRPGKPPPWFFAPTHVALADIKKCAEEQIKSEVTP